MPKKKGGGKKGGKKDGKDKGESTNPFAQVMSGPPTTTFLLAPSP